MSTTVTPANSPPVVTGGALGTPSSGTLTNCTGLPAAGLVNGTPINAAALVYAAATFK